MSFDEFRKELISMHEEDNNKHALQWFLNDIFESAERNLIDKKLVRDLINSHIKGAEEQYQFQVVASLKAIKEVLGLQNEDDEQ